MPLIALDSKNGRRIDARDFDNLHAEVDREHLVCPFPDCGTPMLPVRGPYVAAHFRHRVLCKTEYRLSHGAKGESSSHRQGKRHAAESVARWFSTHDGAAPSIDYEVPIDEIKRIADAIVTTASGERIVVECQLAAITTAELDERTNDYARAGLTCIWYLGNQANTSGPRDWSTHHYGGVHSLQFSGVSHDDP